MITSSLIYIIHRYNIENNISYNSLLLTFISFVNVSLLLRKRSKEKKDINNEEYNMDDEDSHLHTFEYNLYEGLTDLDYNKNYFFSFFI